MAVHIVDDFEACTVRKYETKKLKPLKRKEKCLDLNKKIFYACGLWSTNGPETKDKKNLFFLAPRCLSSMSIILLISQVIDSFSNFGNMERLTENLYLTVIYVMTIVKAYAIMFKSGDIKRLIVDLEEMKPSSRKTTDEEKSIFRHHHRASTLLTLTFLAMCGVTGIGFSVIPIVDQKPNSTISLPHGGWFPYDEFASPYFEITFVTLDVMVMYGGFLIALLDTLFAGLMIHVVCQFQMLQFKMQNIRRLAVDRIDGATSERHRRQMTINPSSGRYDTYFSDKRHYQRMKTEIRSKFIDNDRPFDENHSVKSISAFRQQVIAPPGMGVQYRRVSPATYDQIEKVNDDNAERRRPFSAISLALGEELLFGSRKSRQQPKRMETNEAAKRSCTKHEIDSEMMIVLAGCVDHHQSILRFVQELESVFWGVLLYQMSASLAICVVVYQMTMATEFNAKTLVMLQIVLSAVVELFMYCWYSSVITHESYMLNEAIYYSDWREASDSFKRSIQIIMCRTEQPTQITVAGFVPLSLTMFRRVLKQSYSLYSLLTGLDSSVATALQNNYNK